ncbi:MAG: nicotinate (nicotinamide) nucleotide adenylyltransferase [Ignavibacteria bacterium GWA2_54_16]|nr:MAG: nicotinate (nicotinamide) nucleotide adenylyltransferase [Ignavibacteria bacterium GWA2_54_16]
MRRELRIGIFGGSFDPPHMGHLLIAELSRIALMLDRVYLVPAYKPPHKAGNHPATAHDRLTMARLSVRGNRHLKVSDIELKRRGVSYTVDTVKSFRKKFPDSELFLILGGDSLRQFHLWKSPGEILREVSLAVYQRPGHPNKIKGVPSSKVIRVEGPLMDLSSSDLRTRIEKGKEIRDLVREGVRRFIERKHLYGA